FAVPARVPIGRPRFASFTGIPLDSGFLDDLWPWALNSQQIPRPAGYCRRDLSRGRGGGVLRPHLPDSKATPALRRHSVAEPPPRPRPRVLTHREFPPRPASPEG